MGIYSGASEALSQYLWGTKKEFGAEFLVIQLL